MQADQQGLQMGWQRLGVGVREHKQVGEDCKQRDCCKSVHGIKRRLVEWVLWSTRSLELCFWEAIREGYQWRSHDCEMTQL